MAHPITRQGLAQRHARLATGWGKGTDDAPRRALYGIRAACACGSIPNALIPTPARCFSNGPGGWGRRAAASPSREGLPCRRREFPCERQEFGFEGQQFPFEGQQFRFEGQQFPFEGQEFRFEGQQFRFEGQEFRFEGQEFPSAWWPLRSPHNPRGMPGAARSGPLRCPAASCASRHASGLDPPRG